MINKLSVYKFFISVFCLLFHIFVLICKQFNKNFKIDTIFKGQRYKIKEGLYFYRKVDWEWYQIGIAKVYKLSNDHLCVKLMEDTKPFPLKPISSKVIFARVGIK